jgi:hypothetical protein
MSADHCIFPNEDLRVVDAEIHDEDDMSFLGEDAFRPYVPERGFLGTALANVGP